MLACGEARMVLGIEPPRRRRVRGARGRRGAHRRREREEALRKRAAEALPGHV